MKEFNSVLRLSNGGVPHFVVFLEKSSASVCWMGRSRVWRVFWPYATRPQISSDHKTLIDVYRRLVELYDAD